MYKSVRAMTTANNLPTERMITMAATRMNPVTKLNLKVVTATNSAGHEVIATRSYNVNPELTDDDILALGQKLGDLQDFPVHAIDRQDSADLAE